MANETVDEIAESVAEQFMRAVNGGQRELRAALVERMRHEHRTLQGFAVRVMVEVLRAIGEDAEWETDSRNDAALVRCRGPLRRRSDPQESSARPPCQIRLNLGSGEFVILRDRPDTLGEKTHSRQAFGLLVPPAGVSVQWTPASLSSTTDGIEGRRSARLALRTTCVTAPAFTRRQSIRSSTAIERPTLASVAVAIGATSERRRRHAANETAYFRAPF